jgi:hypothetical protein
MGRFGAQADEEEEVQSMPLSPLKVDIEHQELHKKEFGVSRLMEASRKGL